MNQSTGLSRIDCRLITEGDASAYIRFKHRDMSDEGRERETSRLLENFNKFVSEAEQLFICQEHNEIVGSASLHQFQPGSFGIANLTIREDGGYESTFASIISKLVNEAKMRNGRRLEYRLVETATAHHGAPLLESARFKLQYHRTEFQRELAGLEGDSSTPLKWRALTDLSQRSLQEFAALMTKAAQGDPDFYPDDDALECIRGYLAEHNLTQGAECCHVGELEGKDAAIVIAQVDKRDGWSRITYMGLLPEFREKGLGRWVHRHGFQMLKGQGGVHYHGGTLSKNKPMMRLFEKHGCEKERTLQGWVLDLKKRG